MALLQPLTRARWAAARWPWPRWPAKAMCRVTGGAEGDHASEPLDVGVVVGGPELVRFDGVLGAATAAGLTAVAGVATAAGLTAVAGVAVNPAAQPVPVLGR